MAGPARFGSDLVVDLLAALGIEYAAFNPGASFRGLHDSLVHHGRPRTVLCTHEEISVALAHGYAKAADRPMVAVLHDVVGLQHACMAIFNAWCDRVPLLLIGGTGAVDAARRRPWIEWIHTALVQGQHVRDFVKWDDQPASLAAALESLLRAFKLMRAEPAGPVYVCLDVALQEDPIRGGVALPAELARWTTQETVQADHAALEAAAEWLADAAYPVILADRVGRSAPGVAALAPLAEALAAPSVDLGARFNVPSAHPLDASDVADEALGRADVVLALDVTDLHGALFARTGEGWAARTRPGARVISLSVTPLLARSWAADYQALAPVDLDLVGDTRVALPALADLVAGRLGEGRKAEREERRRALAADAAERRKTHEARARGDAAKPRITPAYLAFALRDAIGRRDFVLSNSLLEGWVRRLWPLERREQWTGTSGGAGIGYGIGASLGVALAHRGSGRIVVDIQPDGDLLYCASALWTAARERLPLLVVMHNNRSYYNSEEHALRVARQRGRSEANRIVGTSLDEPAVDFATLARSFGIASSGPITDPRTLPRALAEAVEAVAGGEPYLVDVVAVPR